MSTHSSLFTALLLFTSTALAQTPPTEGPAVLTTDSPLPEHELTWENAHLKVPPWTEPSGQGVSFGYQHGSWAGLWTQELRVKVPLHKAVRLGVSGLYLQDFPGSRANLGARVLLIGQTPVYLNLMRVYGGGSVEVLFNVSAATPPANLGGGGFFGFEFFTNRRFSFFIEIGGRGGADYSGATVSAGLNLYPF